MKLYFIINKIKNINRNHFIKLFPIKEGSLKSLRLIHFNYMNFLFQFISSFLFDKQKAIKQKKKEKKKRHLQIFFVIN